MRKETGGNTPKTNSTTRSAKPSSSPKRKPTRSQASKANGGPEVVPITQNPRPSTLPPPIASDLTVMKDEEPFGFPGATPLAVAFQYIKPSWRNYIMYVDMEARAANVDAQRYMATWTALQPKDRRTAMPEQLCELASVPAADLVAWVSKQVWLSQSASASMALSFLRAPVVAKIGEFAMASPDNHQHAKLFMQAGGMLPQPARGGGVHATFLNAPIASSNAQAGVVSESSPVPRAGLMDMDSEIVELSKIMATGGTECAAEDLEDDSEEDEEFEEDED
jgi:hypothetical protein